jgi:hypothetical protein
MSFEVKYDRDGQMIGAPPLPQEPAVDNLATSELESTVDNTETVNEESQAQSQDTPLPSSQPKEESRTQESYQARNFRTLRDEKARTERERDEALAKLRAYEMQQHNLQQQPSRRPEVIDPESDFNFNVPEEELLTGKDVAPLVKEMKRLQAVVKQQDQRTAMQTTESKILSRHPDFHSVVNSDNIALLRVMDPELAQALDTSGDFYSAAVTAYGAIKRMAIDKKEPTYEAEKAQIQRNAAKPKPLASLSPQQGDSPLSRANAFANGLTPTLQQQLRKEMEEARRNM